MQTSDRALAKLLVERSFIPGDFILSSGRRSDTYFDCRVTTCFPDAMPLIGRAFVAEFRRVGTTPRSVGGMTMGADPIANAIAYYSLGDGPSLGAFTVRKERKQHGTRRWIEGCAEAPVAIVVTTPRRQRPVLHRPKPPTSDSFPEPLGQARPARLRYALGKVGTRSAEVIPDSWRIPEKPRPRA